jgi:hypothetical protein
MSELKWNDVDDCLPGLTAGYVLVRHWLDDSISYDLCKISETEKMEWVPKSGSSISVQGTFWAYIPPLYRGQ